MLRARTDDVVVKRSQHRSTALGGRQWDREVSELECNNTVIARNLTSSLDSTKLLKATRKRAASTAVLKRLVRSLYSGMGLGASCFCP